MIPTCCCLAPDMFLTFASGSDESKEMLLRCAHAYRNTTDGTAVRHAGWVPVVRDDVGGRSIAGSCRCDLCRLGRVWSLPCTDLRALEAHAHGERAAGSARTSRGDRRRLYDA